MNWVKHQIAISDVFISLFSYNLCDCQYVYDRTIFYHSVLCHVVYYVVYYVTLRCSY